jgi:hypothetical protein
MTSQTTSVSDTAAGSAPRTPRPSAQWTFDAKESILFASHPEPVVLATREDIAAYFDDGVRFWRRHSGGEKVYVVVDYQNLTTNLDEIEFYASQVKRIVDECAITVVRYSGSMLQRMAGRMTAIRLHTPSNAYSSREEALAVIRGLRAGTIALPPAPASPRR